MLREFLHNRHTRSANYRSGTSDHPRPHAGPESEPSSDYTLPPFESTIGAVLIEAWDLVVKPMKPLFHIYGISEPQWRVMRTIEDRGITDATTLTQICHLHPPSVARILKTLEARNLVIRTVDDRDRRRNLIALTPEGREVVNVLSQQVSRLTRELPDRFGHGRFNRLLAELRMFSVTGEIE